MNVFSVIFHRQEYRMRRDALNQLRSMTDRALIDCNFSPELIKEGINAWPWQVPPEELGRLSFERLSPARSSTQLVEHDCTEIVVERSERQEQKERPSLVALRNVA